MTEIKTYSLLQGNPQNNERITDFWNSSKQQTQQFPCSSKSWLKGAGTKKIKKKQRNRHITHHPLTFTPKKSYACLLNIEPSNQCF